jgi:hypothetical protein
MEFWKPQAELSSGDTFEQLHSVRDRHRRWKRDKQVQMVWWHINGKKVHAMLMRNGIQQIL